MWHDKKVEFGFMIVTLSVIGLGGLICAFGRPEKPMIFPYAYEYPEEVMFSDVNEKAT
jgi:hypothetical protein